MKKQAILIQCHNKPEQINALINILPSEQYDFYIHVDKKSTILEKIIKKENVCFVKNRVDVRWGRFSQVEATLELMKLICKPKDYSYCHLISGNDFVIKSLEWMIHTFSEKNNREFIEANYLDGTSTWSWGGLDRIYCYYPQWMIQRPANKFMKFVRVFYRELIMRTKLFKRKKLPVNNFYGGSSWWSLTGNMIEWMNKYLESNEEYLECFSHGVCVDEVFFSTLVMMSPYKNNITNNHMRYMIWDEPGNTTGGPAIIREKHICSLLNSEYAFARKFTDIRTIECLMNYLKV